MSEDQIAPAQPVLRVVRGNPTPEELAALLAVVAASGSGEAEPEPEPSPWSAPAATHRRPMPAPGPSAWRSAIR